MDKVKLFCAIVGAVGSGFSVEVGKDQTVDDLKKAIKVQKVNDLRNVDADKLQLFLTKKENGEWLKSKDPLMFQIRKGETPTEVVDFYMKEELYDPTAKINTEFPREIPDGTIHVLVLVPEVTDGSALLQQGYSVIQEDVVQVHPYGNDEGINPKDERTLTRDTLTTRIIDRLEETHVVLVKSPPMTGKTSLATLVSVALVKRHENKREKAVVFNFTLLGMGDNEPFVDIFKRKCKVDWLHASSTLPAAGCMVYLVMDETQMIYKETPDSSPRHKARVFWETVKDISRSDQQVNLRILMFAAYGSTVVYGQMSTPYQFTEQKLFGIKDLNFTHDEVSEYVTKWFKGVSCFEGSMSAKVAFCDRLEVLTGGHVGLCASAIRAFNEVWMSCSRSGMGVPSGDTWIRMLEGGYLGEPKDQKLFNILVDTRAVKVLTTLTTEELVSLERMACANFRDRAPVVDKCLRNGILTQVGQEVDFSSPVMWRYFVKMRLGDVVRASYAPKTLPDLIARVMQAINYDSLRDTLGRSASTNIPLERSWQMEFYRATCRCTPPSLSTSPDVGALFGSSGFVDFTIDGGGIFWSIELLREANKLAEHVERFSSGGRYSSLPSNDFCLIDFRCVASDADVPMESIRADMSAYNNLFVVCYDKELTGVVAFNSTMEIIYQRPRH